MTTQQDNIVFSGHSHFRPNKTIGYELFHCFRRNGNKTAMSFVDVSLEYTYNDLLIQSIRAALKLLSLGIGKDDVVTLSSNHPSNIIVFSAAFYNESKVASIDPLLSLSETIHILKIASPKIIFTSEEYLSRIEESVTKANLSTKIVVFGDTTQHISFSDFLVPNPIESIFQPATSISNADTALIFFSSGTTGFPKGMCISHSSMIFKVFICMTNIFNGFELTNIKVERTTNSPNNVLLTTSSFYWISIIIGIISILFSGGTAFLINKLTGQNWWTTIQNHPITISYSAPSHLIEIVKSKPNSEIKSSLRLFFLGGANIQFDVLQEFQQVLPLTIITHMYGLTESTGILTGFNINSPEELDLQKKHPLSCGKALKEYHLKVVDLETEKLLGPYEQGEICFTSEFQMSGYYSSNDSTDCYDDFGWIRTGDLGYYDEDYCFYIIDRLKEVFKYKRHQIVPAFLENVITQHPDVQECVVLGIPHATDGNHPKAIVVLKNQSSVSVKELEKFVEERVSEWQKLRAGIEYVDKIPKTVTGKIKRRELQQMFSKQRS